MRLSAALRAASQDLAPLEAALSVARWNEEEHAQFVSRLAGASREHGAQLALERLHRFYPQLGASVRCWPRLARILERTVPRLVPAARDDQVKYRLEIHVSLWRVLSELPVHGWDNERIADALEGVKL